MYSLSSRSPAHPTSAPSGEAYTVSAEFHDVLQREADAAHVRQRPGGVFPLQFPLAARLPRVRTVHPLPAQPLGRHEYGGRMVLSADAGRLRTRFDNWLRDVTGVLREHTETFWMWPASRDDNAAELASTDSPRCPTQAIPRC